MCTCEWEGELSSYLWFVLNNVCTESKNVDNSYKKECKYGKSKCCTDTDTLFCAYILLLAYYHSTIVGIGVAGFGCTSWQNNCQYIITKLVLTFGHFMMQLGFCALILYPPPNLMKSKDQESVPYFKIYDICVWLVLILQVPMYTLTG